MRRQFVSVGCDGCTGKGPVWVALLFEVVQEPESPVCFSSVESTVLVCMHPGGTFRGVQGSSTLLGRQVALHITLSTLPW